MENITQETVKYDTKYNDKFREVTNTAINTVEISPTGSGKTHFYKGSANTIMLMPANSLVAQNGGLLSEEKAKQYDTNSKSYFT